MQKQINSSVKMPPALRERVQGLADARKTSAHAVMLQAIETYVEREEKREALRQAGLRAHEEYQRTGLHLTNAEVTTWLAELAAGNDAEPPACHI